MVPGAARAITAAVWDIVASMRAVSASTRATVVPVWAAASSVSDVAASACDAQVLCGLLHPLRVARRYCVGCHILCGGCCSLCT